MNRLRILVTDDDPVILRFVKANLEARGYETLTALNGAEAISLAERESPALVILDIMMPEMDGFEVCRRLREWTAVPILMLSARDEVNDKVTCLNLGADDYITKPFGVSELLARIRAVLRRTEARTAQGPPPIFTSGNLKINFAQRRVSVNGDEVKLTPTEYNLLQELALNRGKVLSHAHLLNRVWGPEYRDEREYLRVFIQRLRTKLEADPANPRYILTVPAVGYQFAETADLKV